jgi:hypothetical protein
VTASLVSTVIGRVIRPRCYNLHVLSGLMARNETVKVLFSGSTPELRALDQFQTYAGLLDGGPTHEMNERLLDELVVRPGVGSPYIVPPKEQPWNVESDSPFGPYMRFPWIQCRGRFSTGYADLWVIWFQDGWALPIDPAVRAHLRRVDYDSLAVENNY